MVTFQIWAALFIALSFLICKKGQLHKDTMYIVEVYSYSMGSKLTAKSMPATTEVYNK